MIWDVRPSSSAMVLTYVRNGRLIWPLNATERCRCSGVSHYGCSSWFCILNILTPSCGQAGIFQAKYFNSMAANSASPCIAGEDCHYAYTKYTLSYTPGNFSFYNVLQPGFIWTMPGNVPFIPHKLRRIISLGSIKFQPLRGHCALCTVFIVLPSIYEITKMQNHHGNRRAAG